MDQEKIGKRIKEIRLQNNMTQAQFADKYHVTYQAVSKWENGKNLPNITLLAEICKDFGLELNELMGEKKEIVEENKKYRKNKNKWLGVIALLLVVAFGLYGFFQKDDSLHFKTISSNCDIFTIAGSLAYNESSSYLYISNVEYCGEETDVQFKEVECILFEETADSETKLGEYKNTREAGSLESFLKDIHFKLDNFSQKCKYYGEDSLYLELRATSVDNQIYTYQIPLKLGDSCH